MEEFSKFFDFEQLTTSKSHPELVEQNRKDAKKYLTNGIRLSKLLEEIRTILGNKPIIVNSGFRNEALNKAVGSKSKQSSHLFFKAADIVPTSMSIQKAFETLIKAKKEGKLSTLRKVLQEGSWLHVEVMVEGDDYRGFFISHDGNKTWERIA